MSGVLTESQMHDRQGTPDQTWEHEAVLEKVQARLDGDPGKMRIRRQTVEHPFGGINPLPDEDLEARRHRNGAARPGLQHETRDADPGQWQLNRGHARLRRTRQAQENRRVSPQGANTRLRRPILTERRRRAMKFPQNRPFTPSTRFHTASDRSGQRQI